MSVQGDAIRNVLRDFRIDGDPSSGVHHPSKKPMRDVFGAQADRAEEILATIDVEGSATRALTAAQEAEAAEAGAVTAQGLSEDARDLSEQYANVERRGTSVAGLGDPTTVTAGKFGYVSGSGDDAVDGLYDPASGSWARVSGTGLAGVRGKIDALDIAIKSGILNDNHPVAATVTTMANVHTNRVTFTETSGAGTQYVLWDLDKTYSEGETVVVYLKAVDNGGSDVALGIGLYDGTTFRVGEGSAITNGRFYRYELTVPATRTINRAGVYVIGASSADYDATFLTVRKSDEWALFEDGSVIGPLVKELLDLRAAEFSAYVPEGTAPLGPVDIAGLLRSFDAHDLLTTVAGTVKRWDSQDETLSLKQDTLSARPWVNTDDGVYFEDTRHMVADLPIKYVQARGLPPSGVAPNTRGGYTITGMDRDIRAHWITANDGRTNGNDTTFSPSIVILQPDASTIYDEIALSGTFAGIETVQGVAWDVSDNTIWLADSANLKVQHIDYAGTDLGDGITLAYTPNGLAYDAANDRLIIGRDTGTTVEIRSAVDGTLVSSFDVFPNPIDHLHYDGEYIWITEGGSGSVGNIWVYTTTGKTVAKYTNVPEMAAVEGIWRDVEAGKVYVAVDANFHATALSEQGAILEYDVTPPPSGVAPSTLLWSGLVKRTNTTGGKVLWAFGNPIGGAASNWGWALYWEGGSNLLRFIVTEAGTLKEVRWTIDAVSDAALISLEITDGTSVNLHLNGSSTAETPSATVGDWTTYSLGFSVAHAALCGQIGGGGAGRQVIYGIACGSDLTQREKAEGFLIHRWNRRDLLPSGHTYKTAAP